MKAEPPHSWAILAAVVLSIATAPCLRAQDGSAVGYYDQNMTYHSGSPPSDSSSGGGGYSSGSNYRPGERAGEALHRGFLRLYQAPGKFLRRIANANADAEAKKRQQQQAELNRQHQLLAQQFAAVKLRDQRAAAERLNRKKTPVTSPKSPSLATGHTLATTTPVHSHAIRTDTLKIYEPPSPQITPPKTSLSQRLHDSVTKAGTQGHYRHTRSSAVAGVRG